MTSFFLEAAPGLRLPAPPRARLQRPQMALSGAGMATSAAWAQSPAASSVPAASVPEISLQETVVTAVHEHSPLQVVADPKQPRQPVPASDAADYLKSIPGFSAIRSGGSNSDPVFRGQFGSRLPVLTNGQTLLGACPARMDSPSSYISPETYDVLTVVKGPQTVIWGPGASAEWCALTANGLNWTAARCGCLPACKAAPRRAATRTSTCWPAMPRITCASPPTIRKARTTAMAMASACPRTGQMEHRCRDWLGRPMPTPGWS